MSGFSERIRKSRGRLSREEFGKSIGIHATTVGRYERGESEPEIGVAAKICEVYGTDPAWLVLGVGDGPQEAPPNPDMPKLECPAPDSEAMLLARLVARILDVPEDSPKARGISELCLEDVKERIGAYAEAIDRIKKPMPDGEKS